VSHKNILAYFAFREIGLAYSQVGFDVMVCPQLRLFCTFSVSYDEGPIGGSGKIHYHRRYHMNITNRTPPTREIEIELLALDLDTCTRCVGTLTNIEKAIGVAEQVLHATHSHVRVQKILIESEEQALNHKFVTSPTVRISGRDMAFETLESRCDDCTDLCGCDEGTKCRVWRYQGQEHNEAPVGLVLESILREVCGDANGPVSDVAAYTGAPENLKRFFAAKSAKHIMATSSCCSSAEQELCCEPSAKAACCENHEAGSCGCR
jgi:hypothetical protein